MIDLSQPWFCKLICAFSCGQCFVPVEDFPRLEYVDSIKSVDSRCDKKKRCLALASAISALYVSKNSEMTFRGPRIYRGQVFRLQSFGFPLSAWLFHVCELRLFYGFFLRWVNEWFSVFHEVRSKIGACQKLLHFIHVGETKRGTEGIGGLPL